MKSILKTIMTFTAIIITIASHAQSETDKIKVNELKQGEIYCILQRRYKKFIFKFEKIDGTSLIGKCIADYSNGDPSYQPYGIIYQIHYDWNRPLIFPATQKQKNWLETCIKEINVERNDGSGHFEKLGEEGKRKFRQLWDEALKMNAAQSKPTATAIKETKTDKPTERNPVEKTPEKQYIAIANEIKKADAAKKYDAFGNPVNKESSSQVSPKDQKYDAFGNPIKLVNGASQRAKKASGTSKSKNPSNTAQKTKTSEKKKNTGVLMVAIAIKDDFPCEGNRKYTKVLGSIKETYYYDASDPNGKSKPFEYIKRKTKERYPNATTINTYEVAYEQSINNNVIAVVHYQKCNRHEKLYKNCENESSRVMSYSKKSWNGGASARLRNDPCVKNVEIIIE